MQFFELLIFSQARASSCGGLLKELPIINEDSLKETDSVLKDTSTEPTASKTPSGTSQQHNEEAAAIVASLLGEENKPE